jgi:hypothetical protein
MILFSLTVSVASPECVQPSNFLILFIYVGADGLCECFTSVGMFGAAAPASGGGPIQGTPTYVSANVVMTGGKGKPHDEVESVVSRLMVFKL